MKNIPLVIFSLLAVLIGGFFFIKAITPPMLPVTEKSKKSIDETRLKAEAGDARAMFQYALSNLNFGDGAEWMRKSAEKGYRPAINSLASMYYSGHHKRNGIPRDHAEAFKWFQKGAAQNDIEAEYYVAEIYEAGRGVPQSSEEALKWQLKVAEHEDWRPSEEDGQINIMGYHYMSKVLHRLVRENVSSIDKETGCPGTIRWKRKLVEMGQAYGQLGKVYENDSCVKPDFQKAAHLYHKDYYYEGLARLYASGGPNLPRNYIEAYFWCSGSYFKAKPFMQHPEAWEVRPKKHREPKCRDYERHLGAREIEDTIERLDDWASKVDEAKDFTNGHYLPPLID